MQQHVTREDFAFTLDFQVRDYECDIQAIVNNSVYQNYLEHCRHEYLHSMGLSFSGLAKENINLVVTRMELDYHTPLRSGDHFWVGVTPEKLSKLRYCFSQSIFRPNDNKVILHAKCFWTSINEKGRPIYCDQLNALWEHYKETHC